MGHIHMLMELSLNNTRGVQDFPYSVESGIEHYILWSNIPLSEEDVERHVQQYLPNNTKDSLLWFVNPMELQSVPEVRLYDLGGTQMDECILTLLL